MTREIIDDTSITGTLTADSISSGTYTPTLSDDHMTAMPLTTAEGDWQKIGKLVFVRVRMQWSSQGGLGNNGFMRASLPTDFTPNSSDAGINVGVVGFTTNVTFSDQLILTNESGQQFVKYREIKSGSNFSDLTRLDFSNGGGHTQFTITMVVD